MVEESWPCQQAVWLDELFDTQIPLEEGHGKLGNHGVQATGRNREMVPQALLVTVLLLGY